MTPRSTRNSLQAGLLGEQPRDQSVPLRLNPSNSTSRRRQPSVSSRDVNQTISTVNTEQLEQTRRRLEELERQEAERLRQIEAQDELQRLLRRIEELEQLQDGRNPPVSSPESSLQLSRTSTPPQQFQGYPKITLVQPPEYSGRNLRECDDFIDQCETNFERDPRQFPGPKEKILYAKGFLKNPVRERWRGHSQGGIDRLTWNDFATFMRDMVAHPENRRLDIVQKWTNAAQRKDQSVSQFVNYLESLYHELPDYTETMKKDRLYTGLLPSLQQRILSNVQVPDTFDGVVRMAERLEQSDYQISRSHRKDTRPVESTVRDEDRRRYNSRGKPKEGRNYLSGANRTPVRKRRYENSQTSNPAPRQPGTGEPSSRPDDLSHVECYYCHKRGHYKTSCPELNQGSKNGRT